MSGPNAPYTQLSANQVLTQVFDEATDRLRVNAEITASIDADLQVEIDAADGDNIAIANADGSKKVTVTTFASKNALDVNIVNSEASILTTVYSETTGIVDNVLTTIGTYTATGDCRLKMAAVSGSNVATYTVSINASVVDKVRSYFGGALNAVFDFGIGVPLVNGNVVTVKVVHTRPEVGDFNARIDIES